jgi:hypothetical protein
MARKLSKRYRSRKGKKSRKSNRKHRRTRKIRGGNQKIYVSIHPSALGVHGDKEWSKNIIINADKPIVPKLVSKLLIENQTGIDIDEKIAEIIVSIKDSDKLIKPYYGKMITSKIE